MECDKQYYKQQYIGMTSDFRERVYKHLGYVRTNVKARTTGAPGPGMNNMKLTILEQMTSTDSLYDREREKVLIRKFNTFHSGINMEP